MIQTENTNYFIKPGYTCNLSQDHKPLAIYKVPPMSKVYQVPVYEKVREYLRKNPGCRVLELGCGTGYKLNKYIKKDANEVIGVDQNVCIEYAQSNYTGIVWTELDLEGEPCQIDSKPFDVIISADVIEHLVDPDKLLALCKINSHKDTKIFLSTPERDLVRGKNDSGPPGNKLHIREWNAIEFKKLLVSRGLAIKSHEILPDRKSRWQDKLRGVKPLKTCQLAICSL